jgi:hypothetical protein
VGFLGGVTRSATFLALALAVALPATAQAAQTATLGAAVTLIEQPRERPWALGLDLSTTIATPDGSPPSPLKRFEVRLPKATVNSRAFPSCKRADLEARKAPDGCPAGSRLGRGTAVVDARPIIGEPLEARIDVFNGGPGRLLFLGRVDRGVSVQVVFEGVLRRVTGRFGYVLTVTMPPLPTVPGARDAAVTAFAVRVQARRRGVSYIEAPRRCPQAGLPFLGTFSFEDGTTATAGARIPCTMKSVPT